MKFFIISDLAQRCQRARPLWHFTLMNFLNFVPFPEAKCQPRTSFCSLVAWPSAVASTHERPRVYFLASSRSPLLMLTRFGVSVCFIHFRYSDFVLFPYQSANGRWSWYKSWEGNGLKERGFVCHFHIYFFSVSSDIWFACRLLFSSGPQRMEMLVHDVVAAFCCHLENAAVFHRRGRQARQKKIITKTYIFLFQNITRWHGFQLDSLRLRERVNWRRNWAKKNAKDWDREPGQGKMRYLCFFFQSRKLNCSQHKTVVATATTGNTYLLLDIFHNWEAHLHSVRLHVLRWD